MEKAGAQGMLGEEGGAVNQWVTIDLGGPADKETEAGVRRLQSAAVNAVLEEPQQQSDTVNERKCVAKGEAFELTEEHMHAIKETVSNLSVLRGPLDNLCSNLGLEDVSAIIQKQMEHVKLLLLFLLEMTLTINKKLEQAQRQKQLYESVCSKCAHVLIMLNTNFAYWAECEVAMFKDKFHGFDHVTKDEELKTLCLMQKKHVKRYRSVNILQLNNTIEEDLKKKLQKKIDSLCIHLGEKKEALHAQIACLRDCITSVLELHVYTWKSTEENS